MKKETKKENYNVGKLRILIGFIKVRLFGIPDSIYERVVILKKIRKSLKKFSYSFVNFSRNKLKPELGKLLIDIYSVLIPLKEYLKLNKPSEIREFTRYLFKYHANDQQKKLLENLTSKEYIRELIKNKGAKDAANEIKSIYKNFKNSFSSEVLQKINHIFSLGSSLQDFLRFDIFLILKKFYPSINEKNLLNPGPDREISIEIIENELKDFIDSLYFINPNINYYPFIKIYSEFINQPLIAEEEFLKVFSKISYLIKTDILVLTLQYLSKDVYYKSLSSFTIKEVSEEFFKDLVEFINTTQDEVLNEVKYLKINTILKELFGSSDFKETKAYTKDQNEFLIKNGLDPFYYHEQFNVLKKFMLDKYNQYIRKAIHTFIIKASFSSLSLQEEFNNLYYAMNGIIDKILELEDKMNRDEGWPRLKTLILGKSKDTSLVFLARKNILEINNKVKDIIYSFINIGKELNSKLKIIVTAFNKGEKEPIPNIKTFAGNTTPMVVKHLADAFNDINKFLKYLSLTLEETKE
ncbi:MAG TPA: hypothetical protein PKW55_04645 [Spirochaetota bacterium]|nr:hypothetical protein [Spirochaetota bacterium]HOM37873.1 hypothetical protein [Spirochaetota bacterium]HPQ48677.1 hypothetical protein [Spirochaetota bacterium]